MKKSFFLYLALSLGSVMLAQEDTIVVSHKSGWYKDLVLKASTKFGQLVYETDGSAPSRRSPLWKDSTHIKKTSLIRFGVKKDSKIIAERVVFYLIDFESSIPVLSLSTNNENLYDPNFGIYVRGPRAYQDSSGYWINANYTKKWERDVQVNYLVPGENEVVNQKSGLRIFGGMTRHQAEKSLRIIARKKYGKGHFKYKFFQNRDNDKYKHLVIRNSGDDANITRFRDVLSTQLCKNLNIDIQEAQPINLFVNNEFWGVYNLRERLGQHYLKYNFGADIDKSNLLQGYDSEDHGSNKKYKSLLRFLKSNDPTNPTIFDSINKLMDVRNFMNYQIAQIYLSNKDYMGNIRFWQSDDVSSKFRWIMYDTDLGFGNGQSASFDFIRTRLSHTRTHWFNKTWSTFILRRLMRNRQFRSEFINQISYVLGSTFKPENVNRLIDSLTDIYRKEMIRHFKLVRGDSARWENQVQKMKDFANDRPRFLLKNTKEYFSLGESYRLDVKIVNNEKGGVFLNENELSSDFFSASFFKDVPLSIYAIPKPLYTVNLNKTKTIFLPEKDTVCFDIEFKYIGDSPYRDLVKINEVGGLGKKSEFPWLEIINNSKDSIFVHNWQIISKNGEHVLPDFNFKNLAFLTSNKNGIEGYFGLPHKLSSKNDFLYLVDENRQLIDSISWKNDKRKKILGYERELPTSVLFKEVKGLGTPNFYNPIHIKNIMAQKKKRNNEQMIILISALVPFILIMIAFNKH